LNRAPERVPIRPSRVDRVARRRRRTATIAVASVAAIAIVVFAVFRFDDDGGGEVAGDTPGRVTVDADGPTTMAFQIKGTTAPLLAVIAAGTQDHAAMIMPLPQDLTIVGPGQGEITTPEIAGLPGETIRIDLSNMVGTWLDTYAVVSLKGFAAMIERGGGLHVTLNEAYPTRSGALGPGSITLSGQDAKAFVAGSTDDAATRWEIVLAALASDPPTVDEADLVETDDAQSAAQVFAGAEGADLTQIPSAVVAGTVRVPEYDQLDRIVADSFGSKPPTPAIVQNGNGAAGVGEAVGAKLIPAGFRITLSQNAQSFDVDTTDVFANGAAFEAAARRARQALGVGRVRVSQVPSGIGDVLIVVGKDFTS
jgi:polyisoprenyl-teichoic acid--peptidoglycan teichoic acid transferase